MTRQQFLQELDRLLSDLPESERKEDIQYYNDYFDDAGAENEANVIKELGSPAFVARTIRADSSSEHGEYTEQGYQDHRFDHHQDISTDTTHSNTQSPNLWKIVCVTLICLILFPVVLPIFLAILLVLVGIFIGILGITAGIVAASIALPISGILLIAVGVYRIFFLPGVGIALSGVGCILLAVGILLFVLTIWIIKTLLPPCLRAIIALIRYPLRKAGIVK